LVGITQYGSTRSLNAGAAAAIAIWAWGVQNRGGGGGVIGGWSPGHDGGRIRLPRGMPGPDRNGATRDAHLRGRNPAGSISIGLVKSTSVFPGNVRGS